MTRKAKGPAMTAAEARSFGRFSIGNAAEVLRCRPCGCQPYEDVFTFKRWIALGYCVRKGEKAIRLPLVKDVEDEDGEKVRRGLGSSAVFCRHQVKPLGENGTHKETLEPGISI